MPKYFLDPRVEDELWEIWHYIAQDNPDAATRVVEEAFQTFKMLVANPNIGKARYFRNTKLRGIRSRRITGFSNYLIFYRETPDGVEVIHVYHGARDIEALFGEK